MLYLTGILELIKIANLLPYNVWIPDYAKEIDVRFTKKTGGLTLSNMIDEPVLLPASGKTFVKELEKKEDNSPKKRVKISFKSRGAVLEMLGGGRGTDKVVEIAYEIWSEIEENFPEMALYANKAHKTALGQFFDQIPDNEQPLDVYDLNSPFILKLQNFIRATRIRNNMWRAAYRVRLGQGNFWDHSVKGIPPVYLPNDYYTAWENEKYRVFGHLDIHPFTINSDGTAKFLPGIVQHYLEKIDVFRIKTCPNCFRLFWAKPKQMKYCSNECRNRQNVKANYEKNKSKILERKKKNYEKIRRKKNGTL